uniref:RPTOR-like protein n=1 Tax=Strongyloides stercoralis TaxID=6248 RepID=A0A0K0EIF0_STRER|nr:RPTOR-like protein [Strongyloides stercoralis]
MTKTVTVALVLCLNVGTEPPNTPKTANNVRKISGYEIISGTGNSKLSQKIANTLQKNFERLQPRARYRLICDSTTEDVRKLLIGIRRSARDDRVLMYFNGFGVPPPTENGEIWVFDKNITKYIPLNILDLMAWMNGPSVYIWDMHMAGRVPDGMTNFSSSNLKDYLQERKKQHERKMQQEREHPTGYHDDFSNLSINEQIKAFEKWKNESIHFAACGKEEYLPVYDEVWTDIFTQCLTYPVQTSLFVHLFHHPELRERYGMGLIEVIPGDLNNRKTLLGELNWVFTAITDTIAYTAFSKEIFSKYFRTDLLVASLFRSFLLASRVMESFHCTAISVPSLPNTSRHELWRAWDHALDMCLMKLNESKQQHGFQYWKHGPGQEIFTSTHMKHDILVKLTPVEKNSEYEYQFSTFFMEQMTAFEVWLRYNDSENFEPQQLPVLLQVLLSQAHRVRALELLARFLDVGEEAVKSALVVGCFPYVVKLLQCSTPELKPWLAFIWAKILAVCPEKGEELLVEARFQYFIDLLKDKSISLNFKMVLAFVLSNLIMHGNVVSKQLFIDNNFLSICVELFSHDDISKANILKLWLLISLGRLWADYNEARWQAIRAVGYDKVMDFLDDDMPEIRAAAIFALGCLIKNKSLNNEHATVVDQDICVKVCEKGTFDGSELVRSELIVAAQWFIMDFETHFVSLFSNLSTSANNRRSRSSNSFTNESGFYNSNYGVSSSSYIPSSAVSLPDVERSSKGNMLKQLLNRSASFLKSNGRSELRTINEKSSRKESCSSVNTMGDDSSEDSSINNRIRESLKYQVLGQISVLTENTFNDPYERIWLSMLRLTLDPVKKIENMALDIFTFIKQKHEDAIFSSRRKISTTSVESSLYALQTNGSNRLSANNTLSTSYRDKLMQSMGSQIDQNGEISTSKTNATFEIGSPGNGILPKRIRQISQCSNRSEAENENLREDGCSNSPDRYDFEISSRGSSVYTPKRKMFEKANTLYKVKETTEEPSNNIQKQIVSTNFIEKCTNKFKEPILDSLNMGWYGDESTSDSDSASLDRSIDILKIISSKNDSTTTPIANFVTQPIVDSSRPTDWASQAFRSLLQTGKKDASKLKEGVVKCDKMKFFLNTQRRIHCLAFSTIRPYLYCCDGSSIRIIDWEKPVDKTTSINSIDSRTVKVINNKNDVYSCADVSKLMVINVTTREMVVSGTNEGMFKVFDPGYDRHSANFESSKNISGGPVIIKEGHIYDQSYEEYPKMITASFIFNEQDRIGGNKKDQASCNTTFYEWDQNDGVLIATGNVSCIRLWDMQTEKTKRDIEFKSSKIRHISCMASNLENNSIACGSRDGLIRLYDVRMPYNKGNPCVTTLKSDMSAIIGISLVPTSSGMLMVSGCQDGEIKIYDPRSFTEPLIEYDVYNDYINFNNNISASQKSNMNPNKFFSSPPPKSFVSQKLSLKNLFVQASNGIIGCITDAATCHLYDVNEKSIITNLRLPDTLRKSANMYGEFHSNRILYACYGGTGYLTCHNI